MFVTLSLSQSILLANNIRIYVECEGGIEKSVARITDWHHEACRVMRIDDHDFPILPSHE